MARSIFKSGFLGIAVSIAASSSALAASYSTYVSGGGTDSGACSFAAPCRTIQYALGQTFTNGQVHALNAADFGAVSITRAVHIIGVPGASLSRLASAPVVNVSAAAGAVEVDGFILDNLNPAANVTGILSASSSITVKNCHIRGMTADGIRIDAPAGGKAIIENTVIERTGAYGLFIANSSGSMNAMVDRLTVIAAGTVGILVNDAGVAWISNTTVSSSGISGIGVGIGTIVTLQNTTSTGNSAFGLHIPSAGTSVFSAGNNSFTRNGSGPVGGAGTLTNVGSF